MGISSVASPSPFPPGGHDRFWMVNRDDPQRIPCPHTVSNESRRSDVMEFHSHQCESHSRLIRVKSSECLQSLQSAKPPQEPTAASLACQWTGSQTSWRYCYDWKAGHFPIYGVHYGMTYGMCWCILLSNCCNSLCCPKWSKCMLK